jgi:very-short-patch-repair endonuclease
MQKRCSGGYLRGKPLGFKFRRQHPFACYILDFYCHKLQLVIEVDGKIHEREDVKLNDNDREAYLAKAGLTILRFTNDEVKLDLQKVIEAIERYLLEKKPK